MLNSILRALLATRDKRNGDFGPGEYAQKLTRTYGFLLNTTRALNLIIFIWAVSAGISVGGRLSLHLLDMFAKTPPPWKHIAIWWGPVIGITGYAIRAYAVAAIVGISAACLGGILGFLFGLPKPSAQGPAASQGVATNSGKWQTNTNLNEISDWLTKIIVGVGLVEIKSLIEKAKLFSEYVGSHLFNGLASAELILPAIMLTGLILGFGATYLFTQLFLAGLMVESWDDINAKAVAVLAAMPSTNQAIAPNLLGRNQTEPVPTASGAEASASVEPSDLQKQAAENIQNLPLDSLSDPTIIRLWARAQALLSHYDKAVSGYEKLLQSVRTPGVLAEAARVYGASKNQDMARKLMLEAATKRSSADPDVRFSITFDAANLRLYDPPPTGFQRALDLLDDDTVKKDLSGRLYVLRACANGQKYQFNENKLTQEAKAELRQKVIYDLKTSLRLNKGLFDWVRYLIEPGQPRTAGAINDDDLDFLTKDEVRDILGNDPPSVGGE